MVPANVFDRIQIGNTTLDKIEIADTDQAREQGLSGREGLAQGEAMLFVFDRPGYYAFWMKDMKFSIDMIWTDENGVVTGLKEDAMPDSYPQSFTPARSAKYVLEVQDGLIQKENLKIGDSVKFFK